ncbi:unnamed protein product [Parnassius mnemosyne]|uniref:DUF7041 domain-containing protein n=1 Tax=Parnassius mnemosyne TaxID=213953 RepID=A0AAV1LJK8_9NEOP
MATDDKFQDAAAGESCRFSVRPPPFWPEEPGLWFAQMEGQFILSNVTSDTTKFYHVIAQLDHRYATEVKDIITSPPSTNKYEKLITELIKRLSASQERKVKQLLMHEELGDRKPSQFLRHLQHLAGPAVPNDFLKTLWSSRLPGNLQTIIASQSDLPLDKLADLADKVHEIAPTTLGQVASTSSSGITTSSFEAMVQQISELTKQVAKLTTTQVNKYPRYRSRSRSKSRVKGKRNYSKTRPPQTPPNHPHCWYHFTYGTRARKCLAPCNWEAENSTGSRQ